MQHLSGYSNVFIDPSSDFRLDEVNERNYLNRIFEQLQHLFAEEFYIYQFYVLFSLKSDAVPASVNINHPKKILLWFSDESGKLPLHCCNNYLLVFKSYIKSEQKNIFSNPLGYINEFEDFPIEARKKKDIKIFFAGNLNQNRRSLYELFFYKKFPMLKVLEWLPVSIPSLFFYRFNLRKLSSKKQKAVINFSNGFKQGLPYDEYIKLLSRAKFVICPSGFISTETFRHTEALENDCIIISEPMPEVSVYKGNPFLTYKSVVELEQILQNIKAGAYNEEALLDAHRKFYMERLQVEAVANYFFRVCSNRETECSF